MNSLLLTDGYKLLHHQMYPEDTTMIYSNWTPRKNNYGPKNAKGVVVVGVQYAIQYLVEHFNDNFFNKDRVEVLDELKTELSLYTGIEDFDVTHFAELYDLGYLPLMIKALPEGSICPFGVPCLTIRNTKPEFFWLTNYLETILSSLLWKMMTNATIALEYKRILLNACKETDVDNVGFVSYQAHDFSLRGLSGLSAGEQAGMAHAFVFEGSDNIPCISSLRKYYNAKGYIVGGVPATEHSIMSMGTKEDEVGTFRRLLKIYPKGLLSVVSDTWNLWDVLTKYLPILKDEILGRDGKLVVRPDSGHPVDIICGLNSYSTTNAETSARSGRNLDDENGNYYNGITDKKVTLSEWKGVIELLWDTFGGTINSQGYKVLDPHIGAIYGDSITLERAAEICDRLKAKGFASTNIVLGVGSYTYQYNTRDTFGFAMKATYGELTKVVGDGVKEVWEEVETREIYKDPITDDGTKKSAKGLIMVSKDEKGNFILRDRCNWIQESGGELKTVFLNGVITREDFSIIRGRINSINI